MFYKKKSKEHTHVICSFATSSENCNSSDHLVIYCSHNRQINGLRAGEGCPVLDNRNGGSRVELLCCAGPTLDPL